jgi:hypothetical protein
MWGGEKGGVYLGKYKAAFPNVIPVPIPLYKFRPLPNEVWGATGLASLPAESTYNK